MGGELEPNEKSGRSPRIPFARGQTSAEEDERPKSHVNKYLSCMKKSKILLFCQNLVIGYWCFTSPKNSHIRSFLPKIFRLNMFIGTKDTNFLCRNETVFWFLKWIFFNVYNFSLKDSITAGTCGGPFQSSSGLLSLWSLS